MFSHQQHSLYSNADKKRVRFDEFVTVQPVDCNFSSQEEKARTYYSKDELNEISNEVKAIRALYKKLRTTEDNRCIVRLGSDCLRGLELNALFQIRVRNKFLAMKTLLKYQQTLKANPTKTPEERLVALGEESARLSRWSRNIAVETARLDAIRAYDIVDYSIPIFSESIKNSPFPAPARKRRRASSCVMKMSKTKTRSTVT